ncbi:MAG: 30S ribosomal protein S9 [Candidatus ainarchaeum sp.]|nr:30S ribosomal protein S9 [Candidatus ainarchaeum sp.]
MFTRGKRKEAVARASVKKGSGRVAINKFALETYGNKYLKSMIYEPLVLAGPVAREVDIRVTVYGGGETGQAEAARQAIARGIVEFTGDEALRKKMLGYDRHLLAEDSRRVEPKKYKGPKARARFQKSYR